MKEITPKYLKTIQDNDRIRRKVAYESPLWFSLLYLKHHFSHSFAPFQIEMFHLIQNPEYRFIAVMAFRESGKSTIMNMANVLWSILGKPESKFILIISQTQEQAKNHFANIKAELNNNELLKRDFGPFTENGDLWNKLSLELTYHGAKIMSLTRDQAVRGLKYGQYRPDLIIFDDPEDSESVHGFTDRQKLYKRFESEILPLGSTNTRIVVLGNLLISIWSEPFESLILQIREAIIKGKIKGVFRAYPLIDSQGKNLWPLKFKTKEDVIRIRDKLSFSVWAREYLLKIFGQGEDEPNIKFLARDSYVFYRMQPYWHLGENIHTQTVQSPLVEAMKEFHIDVPSHPIVYFKDRKDPEYIKYINNIFYVN